jgi:hypothetical protein
MKYKISAAAILLGMALAAIPAFAHHAVQAEFDFDKPVAVKGTIAKIEWINPHSYLSIDVKDASGKVTRWAFELVGPGGLRKAGLSREDRGGLKPGQEIGVSGFASKDGSNSGFAKDLTLPDGRTVTIWSKDPYGN